MEPVKKTIKGKTVQIGKLNHGADKFVMEKHEKDGHFVRKYDGFGINLEIFKDKILNEVGEILIRYFRKDGSVELYKSHPKDWVQYGTKDKLGADEQIFYSKAQMTFVGKEPGSGQQTLEA